MTFILFYFYFFAYTHDGITGRHWDRGIQLEARVRYFVHGVCFIFVLFLVLDIKVGRANSLFGSE